jgi:hypothetical protein
MSHVTIDLLIQKVAQIHFDKCKMCEFLPIFTLKTQLVCIISVHIHSSASNGVLHQVHFRWSLPIAVIISKSRDVILIHPLTHDTYSMAVLSHTHTSLCLCMRQSNSTFKTQRFFSLLLPGSDGPAVTRKT